MSQNNDFPRPSTSTSSTDADKPQQQTPSPLPSDTSAETVPMESSLPLIEERGIALTQMRAHSPSPGGLNAFPELRGLSQGPCTAMNTNLPNETLSFNAVASGKGIVPLKKEFQFLIQFGKIPTEETLELQYILGQGKQGIVFFSERKCVDGFTLPIALKFFEPHSFQQPEDYAEAMKYSAKVASVVSRIQHEHLLAVRNWFTQNQIRVMEMEWVDGYDLSELLDPHILTHMSTRFPCTEYENCLRVILSPGEHHPRFKAGVALHIIRDCLKAFQALHELRIVHSDIKPANIMLKKTGGVKIIDIGAAFFIDAPPSRTFYSPYYAAPEMLASNGLEQVCPQSDLASLGYVFIQLLSGRFPFTRLHNGMPTINLTRKELLEQKISLIDRLPELLPEDVRQNEVLIHFCQRLVHPDPSRRFQSAQDAVVDATDGLSVIQRSLVSMGLYSDFDYDLKSWISSLNYPSVRQKKRNQNDEDSDPDRNSA
ncbi:MAG: serine/threonine protein kinase [Planctomycetaceae bacterium]|nr:serine/threonine protein kinase [Planctomycetaceae bacterium]